MKQLLILLLVFPYLVFSQCPPDGTFNSQAEIDAFAIDYPDCTSVYNIHIEGADITDLSGLNQITNSNFLTVENNSILQNLNGLNPSLIFYDPLQPTFSISNNAALLDISALATVSVNAEFDIFIFISDNPLLSNLNGIQGFNWATTFTVSNNDSLTSLVGLGENISELTINGNDGLIDLNGLGDFDGSYLIIDNNASLQSFGLLSFLTEYLYIRNNPNLVDISKPDESEFWSFFSITIENNTSLSVCNVDYLCAHLEDDAYFSIIQNNAPGCENRVSVELACGLPPFNDDCSTSGSNFLVNIGEPISFNNELATTSTAIPSCNDVVDRQDVWFLFNSGELTSVDIIAEPGFSIQLWEGDCLNLQQIDGACGGGRLTDIPVTTDTYYWVQIWSDDGGRMVSGWFDVLVQDSALSVNEFEHDQISIYPNPAQNELHIQSSLRIDTIQMFNLLGQQVLESNATTLDISNLTEGLYLVKVLRKGRASTYKIVKQ